jgi:hypothetical protein
MPALSRTLGLSLGLLVGLGAIVACGAHHGGSDSSEAAETASCSPEQQFAAFGKMVLQPVVPPRMFGGLDLANGDDWKGLTIDDAQKSLCAANPIAEVDEADKDPNSPTQQVGWGVAPNYQVVVEYDKTSRKIDFFQLNAGYQGTLDFKSRPTSLTDPSKPNPFGQHTYQIGVDRPILRDGAPMLLTWRSCGSSDGTDSADCLDKQATELFDALMFTFAPELPSTQGNCRAEQVCLARNFGGGEGVIGARPLGMYFHIPNIAVPQPAASTPDYLYGFVVKTMPFSRAEMLLKLDDEGPVATATGLGQRSANCTMKLGTSLDGFLGDCVQVMNDATQNGLLKQKALGGAQRVVTTSGTSATGTWLLDMNGIHPNFESQRFDETAPVGSSRATELALDIRSTGTLKNELGADGQFAFAGTHLVYREYARLVQDFLQAQMDPSLPRFKLGAPECLLSGDPAKWHPAKGCTGMEQFMYPGGSPQSDPLSLGAANFFGFGSVLRPGDPVGVFCADANKQAFCGLEDPAAGPVLGLSGALFDTTRQHVIAVLGSGNEASVPAPAKDNNTYLQLFAKALVKYYRAVPQSPTDLSQPAFDALTPADGDITVTPAGNDMAAVKYKNRFEMSLAVKAANVQKMTFR